MNQLEGHELEASGLKSREDRANETALNAVGLVPPISMIDLFPKRKPKHVDQLGSLDKTNVVEILTMRTLIMM